ncbi:MAG: hypothetical protein GY953_29930, partial [bacterium]|nr:hypothetical protein [bacterium]
MLLLIPPTDREAPEDQWLRHAGVFGRRRAGAVRGRGYDLLEALGGFLELGGRLAKIRRGGSHAVGAEARRPFSVTNQTQLPDSPASPGRWQIGKSAALPAVR